MAATRANLLEVLTPDAYAHLDRLNDRILAGCEAVIDKHNLPGYAVGVGSKGCVTFSPAKIVDYETFKANQDEDLSELAWLFNMNRGIFMTPGREEEWTLSVTHDDASVSSGYPAGWARVPGRRPPRTSSQMPSAISGTDSICEVDSQPNSTPRSSSRQISTSERNTPLQISSQANTSPWKRLRGAAPE